MKQAAETPVDDIFVHVHYPDLSVPMVLRSDANWDQDIQPFATDTSAGLYRYRLSTQEPFMYFKPVLLESETEAERWACGPDRLATAGAGRIVDIFPFFEPSQAQVTDRAELADASGSWSYRVFLPPGYDENTLHRYPVLYMNDGHNLFFPHEAAAGREWGVQDTLKQLDEMTSIEQVIVIGVYSRDRMVDYTMDGSADYIAFLSDSLVPHIDATYRTLKGPSHTAIMGSSLGGASALDCAWSRPDRFGMAGCLSATFGFADDLKHRVLERPRPNLRVYLDSGWPKDNFEVTRDMRARLVGAGFREGLDLLYFAFPGDRHSEEHWGDRAHVPFQFFFGHRSGDRSLAGQHAVDAAT